MEVLQEERFCDGWETFISNPSDSKSNYKPLHKTPQPHDPSGEELVMDFIIYFK